MGETLYIIIPCYNEEAVLLTTAREVSNKVLQMTKCGVISSDSRICFVDDGSSDGTWDIISQLSEDNPVFTGVRLSHNSGEQNAYLAGMSQTVGLADIIITTDADLQDDINAIDEMLEAYYDGNDIVYGVRKSRENEPFITKTTSFLFYKAMKLLGTELIDQHSQYRLMSKRTVQALLCYNETVTFLPALVPMLGYKHCTVLHERRPRSAGRTHYNIKSLFMLARTAITSFSTKPIRLLGIFAIVSFLATLLGLIYIAVQFFIKGSVSNIALLFVCLWLIGWMVLVSLRVIGEYIININREVKKRPRFFVQESLLEKKERVSNAKG